MEQHHIDWKKYLLVFLITAAIFVTALYVSNYFEQKKIDDIKDIQDKVSIDILSSETEFSLLENASCKDIASTTALTDELSSLESKLDYTETDHGTDDTDLVDLKENYSLLEIKDYLLMKQISQKCDTAPVSIIYFYSNVNGECPDCQKEGYVLTQLRSDYPSIRVYSFDYDLDLSAVKTLANINKVTDQLPALIINDDTYLGFQSLDTLEKLPEIRALSTSTTATSTTK